METPKSVLVRINSGDQQAWEELLSFCAPFIEREVYSRISSPADRDEFCIGVWERLSGQIASFKHNGNTGAFRKWFQQLVKWELVDFIRHTKIGRQHKHLEDEIVESLSANTTEPLEQLMFQETSQAIRNVLEIMRRERPRDIQIFESVFIENVSKTKAAAEHGIHESRVRQVCKDILVELSKRLEQLFP